MTTHVVNTHEAKSRLSELIREAEEGAEVIVARNGRPVARIVAWKGAGSARVPGSWSGKVVYGEVLLDPTRTSWPSLTRHLAPTLREDPSG